MKFSIFIFCLFVACVGFSATRIDQLNQLFTDYNKRFVNGVYVKNDEQIRSFTLQQETFAANLKATGGLKKLLVVNNDFDSSLSVTLYAFTTEQNTLIGFYYEKTAYLSDNERSLLRFRSTSEFEKGIGFVPLQDNSYALTVKGFYFKPDTSATLQFIYLTDLKKKLVGALNLFLLKRNNSWDLYNEQYQLVHVANVQTWRSFLSLNGGVQQISLQ